MLSKKQAKVFFLGGTIVFSGIFLGLSYDTVANKVADQTHEENLTETAINGRKIWDTNNCMGCHTLLGEGAYYAPELTKVYSRRGAEWMKLFLKDPQAMFPGERKMVQYDFTDEEINELIEFFKWIGNIDLNGFPAEPDLVAAPTQASNKYAGVAKPSTWTTCKACHAVDGDGGNIGPALDGVANRYEKDYLIKWLKDPNSVKPGTAMPNLSLSDDQLSETIDFLLKLN